jgi:hypothetical protein
MIKGKKAYSLFPTRPINELSNDRASPKSANFTSYLSVSKILLVCFFDVMEETNACECKAQK